MKLTSNVWRKFFSRFFIAITLFTASFACTEEEIDEPIVNSGNTDGVGQNPEDEEPTDTPDDKPSFTPLFAENMEGLFIKGNSFKDWTRSVYDNSNAVGEKSVKITTIPSDASSSCSGSHYFAGTSPFDGGVQITQGKTIWYRALFFIPDSFSFGHKFNEEETAEAQNCDLNGDGDSWINWLTLAPSSGSETVFLKQSSEHRAIGDLNKVRLISETLNKAGDFNATLPRNEWFALQIAVKVSSSEDGFIRAWINDQFIGEVTGKTFDEGVAIAEWGIGNYWNGVPFTDGTAGRTDFWIDEIIITSDADGFGAPNALDSEGHPYISPSLKVADLK